MPRLRMEEDSSVDSSERLIGEIGQLWLATPATKRSCDWLEYADHGPARAASVRRERGKRYSSQHAASTTALATRITLPTS